MDSKVIINNLSHLLKNCRLIEIANPDEKGIKNIISGFETLRPYKLVFISEVVELVKDGRKSFLILLDITYTYKDHKIPVHERSFVETEMIGITHLKKDYGSVLIRPETISDKISELFNRKEIDFDANKKFSSKFYMQAINEEMTRKAVSHNFLKTFTDTDFESLEVEINGKVLLARLRQPFSNENGKLIGDFIAEINNGEN